MGEGGLRIEDVIMNDIYAELVDGELFMSSDARRWIVQSITEQDSRDTVYPNAPVEARTTIKINIE